MSGPRGTTRFPIILTSAVGQVVTSTPPIHVDSNGMELHVLIAPAALIDLEGSLDGVTWVNLTYDNVAAVYTITALAAVGAGYYRVHERPKFVRLACNGDAGGPRNFYAVLIVKDET